MKCASLAGCGLLVLSGWIMSGPVLGDEPKNETKNEPKLADIVKEVLVTLDKITVTLGTVKDEPTAKAAVPDLRKGVARFKELRGMAAKIKPPSTEEAERLRKEYREKLMTAKGKLLAEIARIKEVPGATQALKEVVELAAKKKK
jgi:hypothetical protein